MVEVAATVSGMNAIAYDLSLNSTGVRYADGTCEIIKGLGPKHPEQQRLAYLFREFCRTLEEAGNIDVVLREAPFIRRLGPSSAILLSVHGVWSAAIETVHGAMPVREVAPTRLKNWATGSGKAEKADMIAAAQQLGYTGEQDDEADAYLVYEYFAAGNTGTGE